MTAREKIENLTLLWVLYCLGGSALTFFTGGFGLINLVVTLIGAAVGVGVTVLIGHALVGRNGFVRMVVSALAAISAVAGVFGIAKLGLAFFATWSLGLLVPIVVTGAATAMNVHSLRVLFSSSVRRYFR
ncbi:MAG: hypothetical protein RLO52_04470 [Sandaracinaceae bacterium]